MTTPLELSKEDEKDLQYLYDLIQPIRSPGPHSIYLKRGHLPYFVSTHSSMIIRKEYFRGWICERCNIILKNRTDGLGTNYV